MAPSRKSRSVNRRIPFANDVPLGKAEEEATKNLKRVSSWFHTFWLNFVTLNTKRKSVVTGC